jgi:hypothetical protein
MITDINRQEIEKSKKLQVREKDCKQITEEDLAKKRKELTMDHDRMFAGDDGLADSSSACVAGNLVRGSASCSDSVAADGSSAFQGRFQEVNWKELECLSNVAEIATDGNEPAPKVSEEARAGDGDEELGDGANKRGKGKGKGKKQAWDKERIVAAKIRSDLSALEDLERSINTKKQDAEKVTKELEEKSAECKTEVAVEHNLLVRRLAFVDLVLGEDKFALSHKIRSLKEAQSAQEETATVPSKPVADMPPTSSYESLLTIGTLRKNIQSYWGCNSSAELFLGFHLISLFIGYRRYRHRYIFFLFDHVSRHCCAVWSLGFRFPWPVAACQA